MFIFQGVNNEESSEKTKDDKSEDKVRKLVIFLSECLQKCKKNNKK